MLIARDKGHYFLTLSIALGNCQNLEIIMIALMANVFQQGCFHCFTVVVQKYNFIQLTPAFYSPLTLIEH